MATISYAITACNEHKELERLLSVLGENVRPEDEIVIQMDTTATEEVKNVASQSKHVKVTVEFPLNKDFATFKNNVKNYCTKDYIIFLDADELVDETFIQYLPVILEMNPEVDLYHIPRWNIVEGITKEHAMKWGWHVDDHGRINWPDLQSRICKNSSKIQWVGKVHERLVGHATISRFPEQLFIYHPKTIEKQEKQNGFYDNIQTNVSVDKIGISLGWNCGPAGYGVTNGLRGKKIDGYQTCPFDEMVSNLPGVIECIKDDFKYFMDDDYLEIKEVPFNVGGTVKGEKLIYNTKYNFYFNHESPGHGGLYISQNWAGGINHYIDNNFKLLKDRYNRRVDAFRKYMNDGQNGSEITFIVFRFNKDITELDKAIREKYPNLNFMIVIQDPPETKESVYQHHLLMGVKEDNIKIEVA